MSSTTLAYIIQGHRTKCGLSRLALAKLAGVGKTVIYNLEHNIDSPNIHTLLKVFSVLNIKMKFSSDLAMGVIYLENEEIHIQFEYPK